MKIDRGILAGRNFRLMVPLPPETMSGLRNVTNESKTFDLAANLRATIGCCEQAIERGWSTADDWLWKLYSMLDTYAEPLAAAGIVIRITP